MKTHDIQWYDLFQRRTTRRDFFRVGGGATGLIALGTLPGCGTERSFSFSSNPFSFGVASGDPSADGFVLWSRLAREALDSGGALTEQVAVTWELAEDEAFSRVVRSGSVLALPELGHSVHAEVDGLGAGREYFYRWVTGGESSPVGRTRTAPGGSPEQVRFAFASCQNYEHGYFTSLRHLSMEDVDFVVHLGDYIYEKRFDDFGVREHEMAEVEVTTLDQYRARYTTYRLDPDLQAAHHAAPWIVSTDDHEVDNDYAGIVPEDDQTAEQLILRRAAGYQAFYEFMPLRRSSMPTGPDMPMYRRLRFGDLIDMSVLDTRQYRSNQPCGDIRTSPKPSCAAHVSPDQSILGATQRDWLLEGLGNSQAQWNVLAQQVPVARLRGLTPEGEETWAMDKWDGYPAERQILLDYFAETRTSNPVVLTGDVHRSQVSDLKRDFEDMSSETVATELVGTSLVSGGDGQDMDRRGETILSNNPHTKFYNKQRGYVVSTVTPESWTADYRVVPFVQEPGADIGTRATFVIEAGQPGAELA
jgi:alkaline phosphatase D